MEQMKQALRSRVEEEKQKFDLSVNQQKSENVQKTKKRLLNEDEKLVMKKFQTNLSQMFKHKKLVDDEPGITRKQTMMQRKMTMKKIKEEEEELATKPTLTKEEQQKILDSLKKEEKKKLTEKKSVMDSISWWQWIDFSWTKQFIDLAKKRKLEIDDIGGIKEEDTLEYNTKLLKDHYYGTAEDKRSIVMSILTVFRNQFMIIWGFTFIQTGIDMVQPTIVSKLTEFVEDKETTDMTYGYYILGLSLFLKVFSELFNKHADQIQRFQGSKIQQSVDSMITEKKIRLTSATTKNYEHGCQGGTWALYYFFAYKVGELLQLPVVLAYSFYRLMQATGCSFLFGLSFLYILTKIDKYLDLIIDEFYFENRKLNEKASTIMNECFTSIRTLKLYSWDDFFRDKALELNNEQKKREKEIGIYHKLSSLAWNTLPNFIRPTTFIIYIASGNKLTLAQSMEIAALLDQIEWPLHSIRWLRGQLANIRINMIQIEDYLSLPELKAEVQNKVVDHPDYAVWIENLNFTWGVKTIDMDAYYHKIQLQLQGTTQEDEDAEKTKKQLQEELEERERQQKEFAEQRKLSKIVSLKDITFKVKKGQFVCIIGKSGSGKSSLLSTICGELLPIPKQILDNFKGDGDMEKELKEEEAQAFYQELLQNFSKSKKDLEVNGSIAYTAQVPWIRNTDIRENILYDLPMDVEKYVDTVQYCEFERDIQLQTKGDKTLVGDRGVTLSGGQKARLGLARALYQDKELYLMDDPISALDANTRSQIIKNVYFGVLKDRTRILVTHAIDFLDKADHIVMMDEGRIVAQGSFDEMNKVEKFKELMEINDLNKEAGFEEKKEEASEKDSAEGDTVTEDGDESVNLSDEDAADKEKPTEDMLKVIKKRSETLRMDKKATSNKKSPLEKANLEDSSDVESGDEGANDEKEEKLPEVVYPSKLTYAQKLQKIGKFQEPKKEEEKKEEKKKKDPTDLMNTIDDSDDEDENGEVKKTKVKMETIYKILQFQGKVWLYPVIFLMNLAKTYIQFQLGIVIGDWAAEDKFENNISGITSQALKTVGLTIFVSVFGMAKDQLQDLIIEGAVGKIKESILTRIMKAPVNLFFDVTSTGTIMSRFHGDMYAISRVTWNAIHMVNQWIDLLTTLYLVTTYNYYFAIILPIAFYFLYDLQVNTWDNIKIMDKLSEKINKKLRATDGEANNSMMIRIMGCEEFALNNSNEYQNLSQVYSQIEAATYSYYYFNCSKVGLAVFFLGALNVIRGKEFGVEAVVSILMYRKVESLTWQLTWAFRGFSDIEDTLLQIQKLFKFFGISQENKEQPRHEDKSWPQSGKVEIKDVKLRYRPSTDLVLHGLNVNIKGGEKVGVVGRTGAGKSTLAMALTRIVEIEAGHIKIDGVDISKINLQQLRQSITIIPQDPTLFKGTMRFNLDPEEKCTDEEITALLKEAGLEEVINKQKEKDEKEKAEIQKKLKENEEKLKIAKGEDKEEKYAEKQEYSLLNFKIESGGGNMSSGEKAIICICRAILRKSKVVILDEATATIDLKTEQSVQKLINKHFKDCTMIVIAHRLQTIINSDKVLVLGAGLKKEFGAPQKLLKNPQSHFSKLVNKMQEKEEKEKKENEGEGEKKEEKKDGDGDKKDEKAGSDKKQTE